MVGVSSHRHHHPATAAAAASPVAVSLKDVTVIGGVQVVVTYDLPRVTRSKGESQCGGRV